MNVLKTVFGVTIGIAGGLLIVSAIYPTAANSVFNGPVAVNGSGKIINDTAQNTVYLILPLIGVVVLFGAMGAIAANAAGGD